MRTIIIGDIHGCSSALRLLLAKIMPDEKADRLTGMVIEEGKFILQSAGEEG